MCVRKRKKQKKRAKMLFLLLNKGFHHRRSKLKKRLGPKSRCVCGGSNSAVVATLGMGLMPSRSNPWSRWMRTVSIGPRCWSLPHRAFEKPGKKDLPSVVPWPFCPSNLHFMKTD